MTENDAEDARVASSGGGRSRWLPVRGLRLVALVTVLVVVVGGGFVYLRFADPTEADLRAEAQLIGKTELLIGVKNDVPGVAHKEKGAGSPGSTSTSPGRSASR